MRINNLIAARPAAFSAATLAPPALLHRQAVATAKRVVSTAAEAAASPDAATSPTPVTAGRKKKSGGVLEAETGTSDDAPPVKATRKKKKSEVMAEEGVFEAGNGTLDDAPPVKSTKGRKKSDVKAEEGEAPAKKKPGRPKKAVDGEAAEKKKTTPRKTTTRKKKDDGPVAQDQAEELAAYAKGRGRTLEERRANKKLLDQAEELAAYVKGRGRTREERRANKKSVGETALEVDEEERALAAKALIIDPETGELVVDRGARGGHSKWSYELELVVDRGVLSERNKHWEIIADRGVLGERKKQWELIVDRGVLGERKKQWYELCVAEGREKVVVSQLEQRLHKLPPVMNAAGEEVERDIDVWLPTKVVDAFNTSTEKKGRKTVMFRGGGFVYLNCILDNEAIDEVNGNYFVLFFLNKKTQTFSEVKGSAVMPIPCTEAEIQEVRDWVEKVEEYDEAAEIKAHYGSAGGSLSGESDRHDIKKEDIECDESASN
eukprot:gene18481-24975_t